MAIYITHCISYTYNTRGGCHNVICYNGTPTPPYGGGIALDGAPSPSRIPPYIAFDGGFRGYNPQNVPLKFLGKI